MFGDFVARGTCFFVRGFNRHVRGIAAQKFSRVLASYSNAYVVAYSLGARCAFRIIGCQLP